VRVKKLILYFNNHGDPDKAWCLNVLGNELYAQSIRLLGVNGDMVYSPKSGDNIDTPVAWLEVQNALVTYEGKVAIVSHG
jgi:hypothetical protein